jgi:hypothetical protein
MADEAVGLMDAPAAETGADLGSTDTSTVTGNEASEGIDQGDTPQPGETGHLRGAELYRSVKNKLRNGEPLTPAEQRSIRNSIHIAAKADEATGGDLNKFTAEREAYQQLAREGEESMPTEDLIQAVRADRDQLAGILADIESGAPRLVEELFNDHPESAKQLTTQAMDRLSRLDNERFSNYIARSASAYFNGQGIQVEFAVLDEFLPSLPDFPGKNRVIQAIQKVYQAVSGLETIASKKLDNPGMQTAQPGAQNGDKGADIDRREQNITRYEWNKTAGNANITLRDSEMTRAAGTRKITLTEKEKTDIKSAVREEFETRLAANRRYGQSMQDYLKSGNRREYEKRAAAEGQKLLPSIVARHTNAVIDKRSTAKPAPTGTAAAAKPTGQQQPTKDGNGNLVQWLSGPPKSVGLQVDFNRQRPGMIAKGEAYIVGQKGLHKWKVRSALTA